MQIQDRKRSPRRSRSLFAALMVLCASAAPASADGLICSARHFLGSWKTNAHAEDVAIAGNIAYVAFESSLRLFDITDPAAPKSLSFISGSDITAVAVEGGIACVAGTSWLAVVDVSNPKAPISVGSYQLISPRDVALVGDTAFALDAAGLHILDISNPAAPQLLGFSPLTSGWAAGLAVSNGIAYCALGFDGFQLIDVSDPSSPAPLGSLDLPCYEVAVKGTAAFLAGWDAGLRVIDTSNPEAPASLGSFPTTVYARDVAIAGNTLCLADDEAGLQVFDISDPGAPVQIGSYDTPGRAIGVAVLDGIACIAAENEGLRIVDVSEPSNPFLGWWGEDYLIDDVAVSGKNAYLAAWGVQIVDCSNRAAPKAKGWYNHGKTAYAIAVGSGVAYIVAKDGEFACVDISNPNAPSRLGMLAIADPVLRDVAVAGPTACIAGNTGLHIVDISNPAAPVLLTSTGIPSSAQRVVLAGNRAYIITSYKMCIFDVSTPANPVLLGVWDQGGGPFAGLAVSGNIAIVVDRDGYMRAIDISNPAAPLGLDSISLPVSSSPQDLALYGTFACVPGDESNVQLIDISDPTKLAWVASLPMRGYARAVAVSGETAFVAGNRPGLSLFDLSDCGPPACPADPTNLLTSEPLKGIASLSWLDNANNETGFSVRREQFLKGAWKNATVVATLPANSTTFAQSPGEGFWRYQVQAFTPECDSAWTDLKSVPAAIPGNLTVTKVNGSAKIDWTDHTNFEAKFVVQRQQKVGNKWLNLTTVASLPKNTVTVTNSPGVGTWRYRVRATSTAGNSPYTAWKTITLP